MAREDAVVAADVIDRFKVKRAVDQFRSAELEISCQFFVCDEAPIYLDDILAIHQTQLLS